jgi:hypothetical protein
MRWGVGVCLAIILCVTGGCSSSDGHAEMGTLTGRIAPSKEDTPGSSFEGRVDVLGDGKVVASKTVSLLTTMTYTLRLPPGRYTLRGTVSQIQVGACRGRVTIVASHTTHANVICPRP